MYSVKKIITNIKLLTVFFSILLWILIVLNQGYLVQTLENKTLDLRYRYYTSKSKNNNKIIVIDISEESLKQLEPELGRWPWSRSVYADVIRYISQGGAKIIGIDILFPERTRTAQINNKITDELKILAENSDKLEIKKELIKKISLIEPGYEDKKLVEAVKQSGRVVVSAFFDVSSNYEDNDFKPGKYKTVKLLNIDYIPVINKSTLPFKGLMDAAYDIGHTNFFPDEDGPCRRYFPFIGLKNKQYGVSSFALSIAAGYKNINIKRAEIKDRKLIINNNDFVIPLLSDNSVLINYTGGKIIDTKDNMKYISFYKHIGFNKILSSIKLMDMGLSPIVSKDIFKDKIVLIGSSAAGLKDLRVTPLNPTSAGVDIQANIIDNLISSNFLYKIPFGYEMIYILILGLIVSFISLRSHSYKEVLIFILFLFGVIYLDWSMFGRLIVLPIAAPVIIMLGTFIFGTVARFIVEEKEKKFIKNIFGHYISYAVMNELLEKPDKLHLGGEKRVVSMMFTDIEKYTVLSEKMQPEEFTKLINEYFTVLVRSVFKTQGILDKFIGDAIRAEWNIPKPIRDHAAMSCECALLMFENLKEFNLLNRKMNRPEVNTRIGITTGEMIVGNMGSDKIFDYTVSGIEANAGSRLEPLNKDFGTRILVSERTYRETVEKYPDKYLFRKIGEVIVVGRKTPIGVYELINWRKQTEEKIYKMLEVYNKAYKLYAIGEFKEALIHFEESININKDDGPSLKYRDLCLEYIDNPPLKWEGIYIQNNK